MELIGMSWKNIVEFNGYIINEYGIIIKLPYLDLSNHERDGKTISTSISKGGYVKCCLIYNNQIKNLLIHRLVAKAFIPNKDLSKWQVNHIDGNKLNNHKSNLEWCTDKENKEHSVLNGLNAKGSKSGLSKLNEKEVILIKQYLVDGVKTQKEIAIEFNIHSSIISDIKNNKIWKHVN